ncbi:MAG: AMP-binding protein [Actinomycetota bacterium]|nr:AMP-binding protein [Actinomycetota bacterium]
MTPLFPALTDPPPRPALRLGKRTLSYPELAGLVARTAAGLTGVRRVAVWATPTLETCVGVLAALVAGAAAVPVNPAAGTDELAHLVGDSEPGLVLAAARDILPAGLAAVRRVEVSLDPPAGPGRLPSEPEDPESPALVVYTSGTTGAPKGAVLPRRAIAANIDALADAWAWDAGDTLVHGLPLFHVHGLVLGLLGPVRLGGTLHHLGRFSPAALAAALDEGASLVFGVPTMYSRLAAELAEDADGAGGLAGSLRRARLLVSGSAGLPVPVFDRIEQTTGQQVVERYGLTETLINCAMRADGHRRPGYVGPPLAGVEVRIVDDGGREVAADDEVMGDVLVRGPQLFTGYLNRPEATAAAMRDGWFATGDLATRSPGGSVRIVGRRATDLIKSGGYKIGAGEVEAALLAHPGVAEVAVAAEPDDDLGERVAAWVVRAAGDTTTAGDLAAHVATLIAAHKRPRAVHFVGELPRNAMGKVVKSALG